MLNPHGTYTLFKRETKRFMKVYQQTLIAPVISNILFLAIFGLSIQRSIPNSELSYLQFLAPGLILMGLINNAYQNPSSSIIIMKYQGLLENLMTIPLKKMEILIAFMGSAVLRGLLVGLITYLTVIFFVDMPYASIPVILVTAVLVALFFGFLGMIIGIWADEMDKFASIQNFVLTPLVFLGGVFYPITSLPQIFQKISYANPIVYMINLFRFGFTGFRESPIFMSFGVLTGAVLLIGILCYLILRSGWKMQN